MTFNRKGLTTAQATALAEAAIAADPNVPTALPLPVAEGGTEASTALGARTSLSAASTSHASSHEDGGGDEVALDISQTTSSALLKKTANYVMTATDPGVEIDTTSSAVQVKLPPAAAAGRWVRTVKWTAGALEAKVVPDSGAGDDIDYGEVSEHVYATLDDSVGYVPNADGDGWLRV